MVTLKRERKRRVDVGKFDVALIARYLEGEYKLGFIFLISMMKQKN